MWSAPSISISVVLCYPPSSLFLLLRAGGKWVLCIVCSFIGCSCDSGRLVGALVWSAPSISISVVLCYPPSSLCLLLSCNSNLRHLYDLDVASAVKPQPYKQTTSRWSVQLLLLLLSSTFPLLSSSASFSPLSHSSLFFLPNLSCGRLRALWCGLLFLYHY